MKSLLPLSFHPVGDSVAFIDWYFDMKSMNRFQAMILFFKEHTQWLIWLSVLEMSIFAGMSALIYEKNVLDIHALHDWIVLHQKNVQQAQLRRIDQTQFKHFQKMKKQQKQDRQIIQSLLMALRDDARPDVLLHSIEIVDQKLNITGTAQTVQSVSQWLEILQNQQHWRISQPIFSSVKGKNFASDNQLSQAFFLNFH